MVIPEELVGGLSRVYVRIVMLMFISWTDVASNKQRDRYQWHQQSSLLKASRISEPQSQIAGQGLPPKSYSVLTLLKGVRVNGRRIPTSEYDWVVQIRYLCNSEQVDLLFGLWVKSSGDLGLQHFRNLPLSVSSEIVRLAESHRGF